MKEVFDGNKGNINLFDRTLSTGLYYIKDELSGMRITGFLEMPNDAVACKSFIKFLEDKKDDKYLYNLYRLTVVNAHNICIDDAAEHPNLICQGSSSEEDFRAIMNKKLNNEE